MDWNTITLELNELIDGMLNRGSIGISEFCESILPLRRRLEEGERTEELYAAIYKAIGQYEHGSTGTKKA